MNLPGFNAEASLGRSERNYNSINVAIIGGSGVTPQTIYAGGCSLNACWLCDTETGCTSFPVPWKHNTGIQYAQ
jgi:hypothetical protein